MEQFCIIRMVDVIQNSAKRVRLRPNQPDLDLLAFATLSDRINDMIDREGAIRGSEPYVSPRLCLD